MLPEIIMKVHDGSLGVTNSTIWELQLKILVLKAKKKKKKLSRDFQNFIDQSKYFTYRTIIVHISDHVGLFSDDSC